MLQRFLVVWLTLLCAIAFLWPSDPFVATKPAIPWLISLTMFFIGCLLSKGELDEVFRTWPQVVLGTAVQYTVMPLLGFIAAQLLPLSPEWKLGVIMVGCVPGAMASNVVTLLARGNVSYSVSLTTCSTLLSPLVVPFALWLTLGRTHALNLAQIGRELIFQVAGPVILGHLLCRYAPRATRGLREVAPTLANLVILWIIACVVGLNRARIGALSEPAHQSEGALLVAALLAINLLGYADGYFAGLLFGLSRAKRRALTIEIGMQNAGLGTSLVLTLFPENPAAAIPTALYTFVCMLTGTALAQAWSCVPCPPDVDDVAAPSTPPAP